MSKSELVKELESAGCEVHREYQDGHRYVYVVEKDNSFAKLTRNYNAWYKVRSGTTLIDIEGTVKDFTLKTRAKSDKESYRVTIRKGFNTREWTLSIDDTPATWFLSTLFENFDPEQESISIYGRDWICRNYNEVMKEVCEHLGWRVDDFKNMKGEI